MKYDERATRPQPGEGPKVQLWATWWATQESPFEHKTGTTKAGKFGGGERQAKPPPETRYEPLPLLRVRQTSCCRSCKSARLG